ncbi:uncharacterized protein LOC108672734 isoform X2 [Hyalella azteca]|nr:uncharacterized protein LOC108672734 isoform X2 [Hyalella azteca]
MKRTCSYKYYVRIRGREVQVCKRAFASIHGISDKKIRTLCLKHEQNVMFPRDNRGKHCNRPKKVTGDVVRKVKQHIVQCLSGSMAADFIKSDKHQAPDINVTKLHRHFLSQHEPQAPLPDSDKLDKDYDAKVKPWVYFKVFHEEFKSLDLQSVKRRLSDVRRSLAGPSLVSVPSCQDRYGVCDTTAMPVAPIINVPTVGRPLTEISCGTYNECDVSRTIIPADNALTSHQNSNYQQQPLNLQVISAPNGSTMPSLNSTLHPGVSLAISGNGQPCYFSLSSIPANYVSSAALNSRTSLPSANIVSPPAARKLLTISPPTTTFITTTLEQQHGSPALINSAGPTSSPHNTILGAPSACFYSCCPVVAQVACNPSN